MNPAIEIVGADPVGSIYSSDEVNPYLVEGVGEDFWPETFDRVDRRPLGHGLRQGRFLITRRLAREEGILAGGSGGLAVVRRARGRAHDRRPRGAHRRDPPRRRAQLPLEGLQRRVDDAVRLPRARRAARCRSATSCGASTRRRDAAARHRPRARQGPRRRRAAARAPRLAAAGRHRARPARGRRLRGGARAAEATPSPTARCSTPRSSTSWSRRSRAVAADDPAREAVALLAGERSALLVTVDGRAAGIVTRADLLEALAR